MEMKIANRIKVKDIPEEMKQLIVQDLQMPNPKYVQAKTHGYSTWGIDKIIMNFNVLPDSSLMVPRGYRKKLLSIANDFGVEAEIDDQRTIFPTRLDIDSRYIQFRPHQWEPLHRIAQGETEGMIVAPAGSGKTILGVSIVAILGQPTLWLTHTRTLANQALERIDEFLPGLDKEEDIGIIGDGEWKIGNLFTVGMLQTLIRRKDLHKITNRFGMIILDEAHHCPASTFRKTITQFNPYYIFGLTATPYRRDKLEKVMFQVIGDTISSIPIGKVEEHGGIIRPKVLYRTIKSKIVGGLGSSPIQTILKHNIVNNNKRNAIIVGDVTREAMLGNYCMVVSDR